MAGIGHTLNIAVGALAAQQYGLSVTGHNIANVNTSSYSRQRLTLTTNLPFEYGGLLFGSGVNTEEVSRSTSESLETRLVQANSTLASYEGAETYISILQSYFNEDSEASISNMMIDFWNSWQDLANNPIGSAERGIVYEQGVLLTERLDAMATDLDNLTTDLTREIEAQVSEVNSIIEEIAAINQEVVRQEVTGSANDQRDKRNALVTELAQHIDIYTFEQDDGALNITTANGYIIVNATDAYPLQTEQGQIMWVGSLGETSDITDKITDGRIGGLLDIRDQVVAKYRDELDNYAKELIWAVNLVHSEGAGLQYFDVPVEGTYKTDSSGLLSTLTYGDKIDYTEDFKMWVRDDTTADTVYNQVEVDMDISDAAITEWTGTATDETEIKYVFTVTESGTVGFEGNVVVTDGPGLGVVQQADSVTAALDAAIADQRISVYGGELGTQTIYVEDGGESERSAAAIAQALNDLEGVSAVAFENSAVLDIGNLVDPAANTQENDFVSFTLTSGGLSDVVSFRIGATSSDTLANFRAAMDDAVATLNDFGLDLTTVYDGNEVRLTSASGENIGIEDFDVQDLPVATLSNFQNLGVTTDVTVDTFTNFANGESVDFTVTTAQGTVNVTYDITDDTDQTTLATDFETALNNSLAALNSIGVTFVRTGATVTLSGTDAAGYIDLQASTTTADADESFNITANAGTSLYPSGDNVLLFDGTNDLEQYAGDNSVYFDVNGTTVTIDLRRVDTTDATEVATAFFNGMDSNIPDTYVTNLGTSVSITAIDESAADFTFDNGFEANGTNNALFTISVPGGTPLDTDTLALDGGIDSAAFTSVSNTDTILFDGAVVTESGGGAGTFDSALKTGTLTIMMEPGYVIQSNVDGANGGIFNLAANTSADSGLSILTLGGDNGYSGFDVGDRITFRIDGTYVEYVVAPGEDTDAEFAAALETSLNAAGLDPAVYSITRHGSYVSILKNDGTEIEITNFSDDGLGGGTQARLEVPANTVLIANNTGANSAMSRQFSRAATITWEKFLPTGKSTRETGEISISEAGIYEVDVDGLSFYIDSGDLIAGNTFTLNTDSTGQADSIQVRVKGTANNVLDTYKFTIDQDSGGEIGVDDITILWSNDTDSGSFVLQGEDPPDLPITVEVDGMTLLFDSGTVFEGDVFTITTDTEGDPTVNLPTDWHWTLDSFADQFNRLSYGVKADVTSGNAIVFEEDDSGFKLDNIRYSGSEGFCEENVTITVENYEVFTSGWLDFQISRDLVEFEDTAGWGIEGVPNPDYDVEIVPEDGIDPDNGFYVTINGSRAFSVAFDSPISDSGSLTLDIISAEGDYSFAFSDDQTQTSGLAAALGVNTFFEGEDALSIEVNQILQENRDYIATGKVDGDTGLLTSGDNSNALAITDLQYTKLNIGQWTVEDDGDAYETNLNTTLSDFYSLMLGSLGVTAQSIERGKEFSEVMTEQISMLRDSVSAVSLDEEMINMMKYQHAYTVASKLLAVCDEMLETLVSMR